MFARLFNTIQSAVGQLWDSRFSELKERSESMDPEMSAKEAFREGYRAGYWDGASDLTFVLNQSEMLSQSQRQQYKTDLPPSWRPLLEDVH